MNKLTILLNEYKDNNPLNQKGLGACEEACIDIDTAFWGEECPCDVYEAYHAGLEEKDYGFDEYLNILFHIYNRGKKYMTKTIMRELRLKFN